jgi:hypothetical protein
MRKIPVAELVEDLDFYPRGQVDSHHVTEIMESMRAGVEMPPIIADKQSHRIIDGLHRKRAEERENGPEATIACIEKTYRNDQEMFEDAMRLNARHGRRFSPFDKARAILIAGRLGISDEKVAGALGITLDRVGSLREEKTAKAGSLSVPLKRTIGHMAGKRLNKGQASANKRLGGMNQLFYVNQLLILIENGLLDKSNEELMEKLKELEGLIRKL